MRSPRGRWSALCIVASVVVVSVYAPGRARAQDGGEETSEGGLQWREGWGHFTAAQGVTAGLSLSLGLVFRFAAVPDEARWRRPILFDDAARGALRITDAAQLRRISHASDVLLVGNAAMTLIDALVVGWAVHGSPDVAQHMMGMNTLSFSVTSLVVALTKSVFARQRPSAYAEDCRPGSPESACLSETRNLSFISGHSAMAFTGAGLTCVQHRHLDLYGHRAADASACGLAMLSATLTALFRVMADRHWSSDVLFGAAVGLASGWLMPRYVYFRGGRSSGSGPAVAGVPTPMIGSSRIGLSYSGMF